MADGVKKKNPVILKRLRAAFDDLSSTHPGLLGTLDSLVEAR
jgi:hypothetical protein